MKIERNYKNNIFSTILTILTIISILVGCVPKGYIPVTGGEATTTPEVPVLETLTPTIEFTPTVEPTNTEIPLPTDTAQPSPTEVTLEPSATLVPTQTEILVPIPLTDTPIPEVVTNTFTPEAISVTTLIPAETETIVAIPTIIPEISSTQAQTSGVSTVRALVTSAGMYDNTNTSIVYSKGWTRGITAGAFNRSIHYTTTVGATATIWISGQEVNLVYTKAVNRGVMSIKIDGVLQTNLNQYNRTTQFQQKWRSNVLTYGLHKVEMTLVSGRMAELDAVSVSTPLCRTLTLTYNGLGSKPIAIPAKSDRCSNGKYFRGQSVTLVPQPASGSSFHHWVSAVAISSSNVFTMPELNHTVSAFYTLSSTATQIPSATAIFTPSSTAIQLPSKTATFTLTPSQTASNTLTSSQTPSKTSTFTLTPSPTASNTFTATQTPSKTATFTYTPSLTASQTLSATSTPTLSISPTATATSNACFTLTTSLNPSWSGKITPSISPNCAGSKYTSGTIFSLQASPNAGYSFANWTGSVSGSTNPVSIVMDGDKSVTAINLIPTPISGLLYYVSVNGNDTYPGTQSMPWKTIQKAADTVVSGTILVQAGNYSTQRVRVTRSGSSGAIINFQANGTVVMKGFVVQANYINIRGFEIANTDYARYNDAVGAGIFLKGSNNIIENNYVHDCAFDGISIYADLSQPTVTSNNIIRNNKLYHNELAGLEVYGRNNLVEGNEIWGSVQCLPSVMAVEDIAADNPSHLACPNYPNVGGLDADGIRFFGQGHIIRNNYIHDIPYGPLGLNPAIGDYNVNPHIDCFQSWGDSSHEVGVNVTIEQNICQNLQSQASNENGHGFMLGGGTNNLYIRNNIIMAYGGIETGSVGNAHHLYIYNNIFVNNLSFTQFWPFALNLENSPYTIAKNNIFYNQPNNTIRESGDITGQAIDYNLAYNSNGSKPDCIKVNSVCVTVTPAHDKWNVNPLFINPSINDFHLQSSSPAIDAGVATSVTNDFDGNQRPQGIGYDIGPYELLK